ncbi:acetyltransferase [soil metagenome]
MAKRFLVWGGGGHGKVVAELIRALGHEVCGFADADPAKLGQQVEPGGARVVTLEDQLLHLLSAEKRLPDGLDAVALAVGGNSARMRCFDRLGHLHVPQLVHPTSVVSSTACIGRGSVVFPRAVINPDARIESAVIINTGAIIEHDCRVEDGAHISPGVVLAGGVQIGAGAWIGAGATVIQGIRVGAGSIVGAGAVVIENVPEGSTFVGVPAKNIQARGSR